MTAQNGEGVYGDGAGVVTPLAHKMSQNGPVVKDSTGKPRSGVFYAGNATLVTGKANMSYDVAVFEAAICRGRTKGTSFPTNDAVVNVVTTAAPGSNSRIDIIYLQQQEVSEGDASTQAVIGVVQGTAASSPSAPALPDGAIELARAVVPAGITGTTSATITQTAPFTTVEGGRIVVRTAAHLTGLSPLGADVRAWTIDTKIEYRYDGSAWKEWESDWISWSSAPTNLAVGTGGSASLVQRYKWVAGRLLFDIAYTLGTSGASVGTNPQTNLPFAVALIGGIGGILTGDGIVYDASAGALIAFTKAIQQGASAVLIRTYNGAPVAINATTPITWAAGDKLTCQFWADPA